MPKNQLFFEVFQLLFLDLKNFIFFLFRTRRVFVTNDFPHFYGLLKSQKISSGGSSKIAKIAKMMQKTSFEVFPITLLKIIITQKLQKLMTFFPKIYKSDDLICSNVKGIYKIMHLRSGEYIIYCFKTSIEAFSIILAIFAIL